MLVSILIRKNKTNKLKENGYLSKTKTETNGHNVGPTEIRKKEKVQDLTKTTERLNKRMLSSIYERPTPIQAAADEKPKGLEIKLAVHENNIEHVIDQRATERQNSK